MIWATVTGCHPVQQKFFVGSMHQPNECTGAPTTSRAAEACFTGISVTCQCPCEAQSTADHLLLHCCCPTIDEAAHLLTRDNAQGHGCCISSGGVSTTAATTQTPHNTLAGKAVLMCHGCIAVKLTISCNNGTLPAICTAGHIGGQLLLPQSLSSYLSNYVLHRT